jgi:benzoyl-CoA reductase subunit BamB
MTKSGTSENFMWGNSRVRRNDFWNEDIESAGPRRWKLSHPPDQLLQLPDEMRRHHRHPGLPTFMMKCFTKLTYTMAAFSDLDFGMRIAQRATEYGVDGFTAPQVMAMALELLEKGILTKDDFPGMPEDSEGRFYWLLDRIVRREGIGDVLANGTYWAAKAIGTEADPSPTTVSRNMSSCHSNFPY